MAMRKKNIIFICFAAFLVITFVTARLGDYWGISQTIGFTLVRFALCTPCMFGGFWCVGDIIKAKTKRKLLGSFVQFFPMFAMLMALLTAIEGMSGR